MSLKRLFGREKHYEKNFDISTLDTLAQKVGYYNWEDFLLNKNKQPILKLLRSKIEAKFNFAPSSSKDCIKLAKDINIKNGNTQIYDVDKSVILILWGYSDKMREEIATTLQTGLDDVCRIIGYNNFKHFRKEYNSRPYIIEPEDIEYIGNSYCNPFEHIFPDDWVDNLSTKEKITVGFPPFKYCVLEYLGDHQFRVIQTSGKNMNSLSGEIIQTDDIFFEQSPDNQDYATIKYWHSICDDDFDENGNLKRESLLAPRLL